MAVETVAIQTASGASAYIAGDLVGTTFFPFSKLDVGADGVSSPVVTALPVTPSGSLWASAANQATQITHASTSAAGVGVVGETTSAYPSGSRMLLLSVTDAADVGGSIGQAVMPRVHKASGGMLVSLATGLDPLSDTVSIGTPTAPFSKAFNSTSSVGAGSAAVVYDPTSGKKIRITSLDISTYGTTAGRIMLFFADDADLTYTAGTDQPIFVGSFAPSATAKPGVAKTYVYPIKCDVADRRIHYQNDAAISVDITIHGYEES